MPSESHRDSDLYPQLVAFDLDYTLWDLWIDTHVTGSLTSSVNDFIKLFVHLLFPGPLKRKDNTVNQVVDKHGEEIAFYDDVPHILQHLRNRHDSTDDEDRKVIIAVCSRTHAPTLARRCLELMLVKPNPKSRTPNSKPAITYFDELEIYPGSKLQHFKKLHERTGIPYSQMLFFDDEHRNSEVEKLGVTFLHVPRGLTRQKFDDGLKEWRRRQ